VCHGQDTSATASDQIQNLKSKIALTAHRTGFGWRARREIARLRQADGAVERKLAGALEAALGHEAAEEPWIGRIEALREALLRSDAEVSFRDYGVATRLQARRWDGSFREVTRAVRAVCRSSVPPHQGRVLFHLIRAFRPRRCLELGTCLGISAAYQAAALTINGAGRLVTLEGGAALARLAEAHFERLGLPGVEVVTGRFADTLPAVLPALGPIDFAFIDGHHDPAAMQAYYGLLVPHLADGAVLVFDDIFWSSGMRHAWRALTADRRMGTAVDLLTFGICFYNTKTPA